MPDDIFTVKICPLCQQPHKYSLIITKSSTQLGESDLKGTRLKTFKRLVTCPNKNEAFLATLELKESPGKIIRNVSINGVIKDDKNEPE